MFKNLFFLDHTAACMDIFTYIERKPNLTLLKFPYSLFSGSALVVLSLNHFTDPFKPVTEH
jgi:hypothetical protein